MESSARSGLASSVLRGKSVVVADDTPLFRRALVRQLEVLGLGARGVDSLSALEETLKHQSPDAVLLDWHFGGSTAEGVLELLRARWVPVIVLTGDPGGVEVTGVPVLGKPVQLETLQQQLLEILGSGLS